ncbi:MAG: glycosyltransferase, partial [Balneolales bacterium]
VGEIVNIPRLYNLYNTVKPDLVHHISVKSLLSGSMVSALFRNTPVVCEISGRDADLSGRKIGRTLKKLPRSRAIFHNSEDQQKFIESGWVKPGQTKRIRDSGVDCSYYKPVLVKPDPQSIVLLHCSLIRDNGIKEFVEAARIVRSNNPAIRFVLAGIAADTVADAVPVSQLKEWQKEGIIEWWGQDKNELSAFQEATIITLPAIKPGKAPMALLKAAAAGIPVIASDLPGLREAIKDGVNGTLIPASDSEVLAKAVLDLVNDPETAERYGQAGREIAVNEFSQDVVIHKNLSLYKELLGERLGLVV